MPEGEGAKGARGEARLARRAGGAALAALLVAPFPLVAGLSRAAVDRAALVLGPKLADVADAIAPEPPAPAAPVLDERAGPAGLVGIGDPADVSLAYGEPFGDARAGTATPSERAPFVRAKRTAAPPTPRGVLVRAEVVARAARSGMRPSGHAVPATAARPAGLALVGVGPFGLRDGDVLTHVAGAPATSEGAVVSAVAGALRAGARAISGVAWRGDQRIAVTVEIPDIPKTKTKGKKARPPRKGR